MNTTLIRNLILITGIILLITILLHSQESIKYSEKQYIKDNIGEVYFDGNRL